MAPPLVRSAHQVLFCLGWPAGLLGLRFCSVTCGVVERGLIFVARSLSQLQLPLCRLPYTRRELMKTLRAGLATLFAFFPICAS